LKPSYFFKINGKKSKKNFKRDEIIFIWEFVYLVALDQNMVY
jgi:hypothetical protein